VSGTGPNGTAATVSSRTHTHTCAACLSREPEPRVPAEPCRQPRCVATSSGGDLCSELSGVLTTNMLHRRGLKLLSRAFVPKKAPKSTCFCQVLEEIFQLERLERRRFLISDIVGLGCLSSCLLFPVSPSQSPPAADHLKTRHMKPFFEALWFVANFSKKLSTEPLQPDRCQTMVHAFFLFTVLFYYYPFIWRIMKWLV